MPILGILASSTRVAAGDFESIATVTVGSGGAANVEFTSIPSTYSHLQIRGLCRTDRANVQDPIMIRLNSSTSTYAAHNLFGNGTSVTATSNNGQDGMLSYGMAGNDAGSNTFGVLVCDILDYKDTNKNTTIRVLAGYDNNGTGNVSFNSGLWTTTNAVTTIRLYPSQGSNLLQYSHFALYGIKSA